LFLKSFMFQNCQHQTKKYSFYCETDFFLAIPFVTVYAVALQFPHKP
jgi:hypothetical protein